MSRRTRHALGFTKIPLLYAGRLRIVLHSWEGTAGTAAVEDIHDHRFSFLSVVLRGTVTERRYELAGGDTHAILEAPAGGADGCDVFATGRRAAVRQVSARTRRAPAVYAGRMGGLHRVIASPPALTLFIKLEHKHGPAVSTVLREGPP